MIPPSLPLLVHLSIHLPVLATRSHLVAQQHDDHVLLGVLIDLCQPCLEMEREHKEWWRNPKRERKEGKGESTEELGMIAERDWNSGDRGDRWIHRGERQKINLVFTGCSSSRLPSRSPLHPSSLLLHLYPSIFLQLQASGVLAFCYMAWLKST